MDFQECVSQCVEDSQVIEAFNRLHDINLTQDLIGRLRLADGGTLSLDGLNEIEQAQLACFILFVHRQIWRKLKFAHWRVTRSPATGTSRVDMPNTETSCLDELMQRAIAS